MKYFYRALFILISFTCLNKAQAQVITTSTTSGIISSCVGSASASPNILEFTVKGTALAANIIATAPGNFEVSLSFNSGYGNSVSIAQLGGVVNNVVVYVRSAASANVGNISGNIVLSSNAVTQNVVVAGKVNAPPIVNAVADQTVVAGTSTAAINFTGTGDTFNWVNDNPSIGLPASGTGNINAFTAINGGAGTVTAKITVTPAAASFAYVPNTYGRSVSVINCLINKVITTIPLQGQPLNVSINPDGSRVYVSNGDLVSVINTNTNTLVKDIPMGVPTYGVVVSPDGNKVYTVSLNDNSISIIDAATNTVSEKIPIAFHPWQITISPDGTKLFMAEYVGTKIAIFDVPSRTLTGTVSIGTEACGMAVTPDGKTLYVGTTTQVHIWAINTVTNTPTRVPVGGTHPQGVAISSDGKRVYVACSGSDVVSVVNTADNSVMTNIPVGSRPFGISVTGDGSRVYVTNFNSDDVSVINTANNTEITRVPVGDLPDAIGNFIKNGTGCSGTPLSFNIRVNSSLPTINTSGSLSALNTTYGTPSATSTISVSGTNIAGGIQITPPVGFELSLDNVTFSNSVTVPGTGTINATTVYIRLAAITNAGTYAGNVVFKSAGAAEQAVPIANSTVNPAPFSLSGTLRKTYGVTSTDFDVTNAPAAFSNQIGLKNGNRITGAYISVVYAGAPTTPVGTYPGGIILSAVTGDNGFLPGNYAVTYNPGTVVVEPAPLNIKANDVTKAFGTQLTGGSGSTAYTTTGLQNGETTGSVSVMYGAGAAVNATAGTYVGSVVASGVTGGTFSPGNYTITYSPGNITVSPPLPPVITATGSVAAMTTVYGDASVARSFNVSAINIINGIVVTPPAGFEVSLDNVSFSNTVTIKGNGVISPTTVYIRLAAATAAGPYFGQINFTSGSVTANNVTVSGTVSPAPLTITANNVTKTFGTALVNVPGSTSFTAAGLKNGETIATVTITYGAGAAANAPAGLYAGSVTLSAPAGGTFRVSNYTIVTVAGSLTVEAVIIAAAGSPSPVNTIYGTPSSASSFDVRGTNITGGILITPPNGFEVSLDRNTYSPNLTVGTGGSIASTTVYIRLAAVSPVRSYTGNIVASSLNAADKNILMPSSTVSAAQLSIIADNKDKFYDTANPPLTLTYHGFVNNESERVLTVKPLISTQVSLSTPVGQYPITISGAVAANYSITYVNGGFTVRYASLEKYIPNTFTPNGDGVNDTWNIAALAGFPNCAVNIFNRNGTLLFTSVGYSKAWDGTYNGALLPSGTYFYVIDLKGSIKVTSGSITILR